MVLNLPNLPNIFTTSRNTNEGFTKNPIPTELQMDRAFVTLSWNDSGIIAYNSNNYLKNGEVKASNDYQGLVMRRKGQIVAYSYFYNISNWTDTSGTMDIAIRPQVYNGSSNKSDSKFTTSIVGTTGDHKGSVEADSDVMRFNAGDTVKIAVNHDTGVAGDQYQIRYVIVLLEIVYEA